LLVRTGAARSEAKRRRPPDLTLFRRLFTRAIRARGRPAATLGAVLRRLASFCYRRRRLVVAAWIVAVVGLSFVAGSVGDDFSEGFSVKGTESSDAQDLLHASFPERAGDSGQLVIQAPSGVTDPAVQQRVEDALAEIERVPDVSGTTSPYSPEGARQVAPNGRIAYADIQFDKRAGEVHQATAERIIAIAHAGRQVDGATFELGGRMFQIGSFGGSSELIGLAAAILILLIAFGSVLAMGLPIFTAILGIGAGFAVVELLSNVMVMPEFTTQLAAMIGLGVGIDYALFIVTRYRQGLQDGLDPERSVMLALDTAGRAVLFAGATVVISLCGLFLMGVDFIRGLGAGAASTVLLMMIASVTFVPALLGFCGTNIDKLSIPGLHRRENATRESMWFRWSRIVQRRPWAAFFAGLAILLLLAVPFLSLRLGFSDTGNGPTTDTTRRAYDLLSEGFGPGFNGPLVVAARTPQGAASLDQLAERLGTTPGVARVSPVVANADGTAAVIQVIPTTSPQSEATVTTIDRIRGTVIPPVIRGTGATVFVGGITASGSDVSDTLASRLPLFIGAVLAFSFILLLCVFRSVLVPVKAVVMNLLSIAAAYGVVVAIFQWGWLGGPLGIKGTGPIEPFVPMMLFAIVFGLSMDYEVFLLSRIREEYDRTGDNALAVADGLAATARVITAAAAIMIMVFASFVLGDERVIKLFGLGLASAIFIDATLVRVVLVPATMELLGDRNWWFPRWLEWIPQLHVEADPDLEAELLELQEAREQATAAAVGSD
jgi:RND superfamily putative drug exporter